jgi:hypothetical protein
MIAAGPILAMQFCPETALSGPEEQQCKRGAGGDCTLCVLDLGIRERLGSHDRVTPLVQGDAFGKQLGAEAMAGACDRVDGESLAHKRYLQSDSWRGAPSGTGRKGSLLVAVQ